MIQIKSLLIYNSYLLLNQQSVARVINNNLENVIFKILYKHFLPICPKKMHCLTTCIRNRLEHIKRQKYNNLNKRT